MHFNGVAIDAIEINEAAPHLTPKPFHIASRSQRPCRVGIPGIFSKERGSIYTPVRHLGMAGYTPTQIRKPSNETKFEKQGVVFKNVLNDQNVKRLGTRGQGRTASISSAIAMRIDTTHRHPVQIEIWKQKLTEREVKKEVGNALLYRPALTEYFYRLP